MIVLPRPRKESKPAQTYGFYRLLKRITPSKIGSYSVLEAVGQALSLLLKIAEGRFRPFPSNG